jgi:hypothetical protein
MQNDPFSIIVTRAIEALVERNEFKCGDAKYELRSLLPIDAWRSGAEIDHPEFRIFGGDSCGNQFLIGPDGSVAFWDHETDEVMSLSPKMELFLAALVSPTPVTLKPGQVKRVWIDPAFIAKFRDQKNA